MSRQYTLAELEAMPTITVGQADDLKIDEPGEYRVWLSRCGVEAGEPYPNKVTVERWVCDKWTNERTYQAL